MQSTQKIANFTVTFRTEGTEIILVSAVPDRIPDKSMLPKCSGYAMKRNNPVVFATLIERICRGLDNGEWNGQRVAERR